MSTSLAVRHRPHTWATVAGQGPMVEVLRNAATRRPVPPQIMLAGPSGVGKTTMARIFAAGLFCPDAIDGDGCGTCQVCVDVTGPGGRHPDVIELDAASNGGIERIRALAGEASLAPMLADYRVYIIDEAHGLTKDGGQAFLRLLEEPAPHTIFVLATTDPQKLPDALRGRCLAVYVTTPDRDEKVENLRRICATEGWIISDDVLGTVVDGTDPALGVRGTVTNLDKVAGHLAPGETTTAAEAAVLLGVADPAVFAGLTDAISGGDKAGALQSLRTVLGATSRAVVHAQLVEWARARTRQGADVGRVEDGVWMLEQLFGRPPEQLEVAVAKMAQPALGGAAALAVLVERAEAAASQLGTTSIAHDPVRRATVPPSRPPERVASPEPVVVEPPQAAPPLAPSPQVPLAESSPPPPADVVWSPVPPSDSAFMSWCNEIARTNPMWALTLRRAVLERSDAGWRISSLIDEPGLRDALTSSTPLPVTFS